MSGACEATYLAETRTQRCLKRSMIREIAPAVAPAIAAFPAVGCAPNARAGTRSLTNQEAMIITQDVTNLVHMAALYIVRLCSDAAGSATHILPTTPIPAGLEPRRARVGIQGKGDGWAEARPICVS